MRNRHGEDSDLAVASGCWECPKCRKSCGDGCDNCCNCGPCRKKAGLAPTHQVIRIARENGFDNVHDYLVWEKVGGTPESIKMRKKKFEWGQWIFDETLCAKCPSEDATTTKKRVAIKQMKLFLTSLTRLWRLLFLIWSNQKLTIRLTLKTQL